MKIIDHIKAEWFRYGFETLAVVAGILVAFALDNWNEERQLHKTERNLLIELQSNLQTNILNLENDISKQIRGAWCIDYLIDHLEHKRPLNDSIPVYLVEADYAPDVVLTSSAFETLKSTGLGLIRTDSLRWRIIDLFEVTYPTLMQETRRLEDQVWPAVVVPLYQKHFRFTDKMAIPVNYPALLDDQEFINMLSFRGQLRKESTIIKREVRQETAAVMHIIEQELN